jgi:hypothetical protein
MEFHHAAPRDASQLRHSGRTVLSIELGHSEFEPVPGPQVMVHFAGFLFCYLRCESVT